MDTRITDGAGAEVEQLGETLLITTLAGCGLVLFITGHGFLVALGGLKLRFAYSERNVSEALIRIGIGLGPRK